MKSERFEVEIPKLSNIEEKVAYVASEVTTDLYDRGCEPEEIVDAVDIVNDLIRGKISQGSVKCKEGEFVIRLEKNKVVVDEKPK